SSAAPDPEIANTPPAAGSDARVGSAADIAALLFLGLALALPWRGHFIKPHYDFYQFCETGRSLLHGELPATFKRAPLFPLLIAAGGAALRAAGALDAPELTAGEWLNAL